MLRAVLIFAVTKKHGYTKAKKEEEICTTPPPSEAVLIFAVTSYRVQSVRVRRKTWEA